VAASFSSVGVYGIYRDDKEVVGVLFFVRRFMMYHIALMTRRALLLPDC
jgi:hypothetical protein